MKRGHSVNESKEEEEAKRKRIAVDEEATSSFHRSHKILLPSNPKEDLTSGHLYFNKYPPSFSNFPIVLVVGEKSGTTPAELRKEVKRLNLDNVVASSAHLPLPYGVHHSKLSLFEDSDNGFHVVISTANLLEGDWRAKTQMFYYMRGHVMNELQEQQPAIIDDLLQYLQYYKLSHTTTWLDRLKYARFEDTDDRLVFSYPGFHKGEAMKKVGHLSLRKILNAVNTKNKDDPKLLICQSSSIGSLGPTHQSWICSQFLSSLRGGCPCSNTRMFIIFPTLQDVKNSFEGIAAGGSLPYRRETDERQPWLKERMCKWRANNWGRTQAMPHVKTYTQIDKGQPEYQIVTSANLSKAAWGELQKDQTQLMVRSYEIGVVIMDKERIRIPYDYPIARYGKDDQPWLVNDLDKLLREELLNE